MASSVFKIIHAEKRSKIRDMNDVRTRASKRLKETRKSQREALLNLHRRVEIKPEVKRKKTQQEEVLSRLKSYREEKLKRMEEQKRSKKPPFCSIVRTRHTGGTPFRMKQQEVKNVALNLPPVTRSRTAFQKEFVFKATLKTMDQNGSKQEDVLPTSSAAMRSRSKRNNKENQEPTKSNLKTIREPATVTVKAPLVKDVPTLANLKAAKSIPISTSRSRRQNEIPATITIRPRRRAVATNNNVDASIVDNAQKKKNEIKHKSPLVAETAFVSDVKKEKEIKSKKVPRSKSSEQLCSDVAVSNKVVDFGIGEDKSNSKEHNVQEEVNNILADKLAERVFIMSPLITSKVVTRSTRRRPRPSTGNLKPSEIETEKMEVEKEKSENKEIQRKSVDKTASIGPEALRDRLEEETSRLNSLADTWSTLHAADSNSIPEHVKDEILAVVGQTRLLISDKFKQFRSLIDNALSESRESAVVIKTDDLLGFWEMVYLQVEKLDRAYKNLASLAENGWCSLEKQETNKTKKKVKAKKPATSASSKFKEFLKKKKGEEANKEEFNNTILPGTPGKRTPSLLRVADSERKARRSSAINITLQKSFLAKAVLSPLIKS